MEKKKRESENSVSQDTPHCHNTFLQHIGACGFVIKWCHSTEHLSQQHLSLTLSKGKYS